MELFLYFNLSLVKLMMAIKLLEKLTVKFKPGNSPEKTVNLDLNYSSSIQALPGSTFLFLRMRAFNSKVLIRSLYKL